MLKLSLEELRRRIRNIKELWFDIDGVMTRQQSLKIYDRTTASGVRFERSDGIESVMLVPCDAHGNPVSNTIEYIAGFEDEPIFEGYTFDTRDGRVVELAVRAGYPVYFISGRHSPAAHKRATSLGAIPHLGAKDKVALIERVSPHAWEHRLFVGDGMQDKHALAKAGIPVAPYDACPEALEAALWVTHARGGEGVIHEVMLEVFEELGVKLS